jgi:hypothetical protein
VRRKAEAGATDGSGSRVRDVSTVSMVGGPAGTADARSVRIVTERMAFDPDGPLE